MAHNNYAFYQLGFRFYVFTTLSPNGCEASDARGMESGSVIAAVPDTDATVNLNPLRIVVAATSVHFVDT